MNADAPPRVAATARVAAGFAPLGREPVNALRLSG